ncbi:Pro-Pol polyprotein like [Argiope bruennichi]|uniref:Pro-Pol polyprotein like n=1 Tax=Argiope bruennichi TaxID=94029 RepID=A0A8T0FXA8_ARGBR|nr:Pro-Pol polyprotein like [Argiope bruennichi]
MTKFVRLRPCPSCSTKNVLKYLDEFTNDFGCPRRIVTDRGSCFSSSLFEDYCKQFGIKHTLNTSQRPQANGQVERINRILIPMISSSVQTESHKDWDKILPEKSFITVEGDLKVIELCELILKTSIYKEVLDFVKDTQKNIMTERLEREERERVADEKERIERDRAYELEKLRLQVESQKLEQTTGLRGCVTSLQLTRKKPESTWKDFHFELRSYFEAWLAELNITKIEELKDLVILDQMKKRVLPEFKNHFIDVWSEWVTPNDLVEKLDSHDNLRSVNLKLPPKPHETKAIYPKRNQYQSTQFEQSGDRQDLPWIPSQSRRNPGSSVKVGGIPATKTDPLYQAMVVERQEL